MTVDWSKPIQTRRGTPARVLGQFESCGGPRMAVAVERRDNIGETYEDLSRVYLNGRFYQDEASDADIVNAPERRERWIGIYPPNGQPSLEGARYLATDDCLGFVGITYEDDKPVSVELVEVADEQRQ